MENRGQNSGVRSQERNFSFLLLRRTLRERRELRLWSSLAKVNVDVRFSANGLRYPGGTIATRTSWRPEEFVYKHPSRLHIRTPAMINNVLGLVVWTEYD